MLTRKVLAWPAFAGRSRNPYNALLYDQVVRLGIPVDEFSVRRLCQGPYSVWHVHWPERFLNDPQVWRAAAKSAALLKLLDLARARRICVLWTAHNLQTHEQRHPRLERWFWRGFVKRVDGYISLTEVGIEDIERCFPGLRAVPHYVVPHGHYRGEYADVLTVADARKALHITPECRVFLFFGQIRKYKNVVSLMRAFREIADPSWRLLVAGLPSADLREEVVAVGLADSRVTVFPDFVPADRVQFFFKAADVVVLPYSEIFNSASALLALSFNRPLAVPRSGPLAEVQELVGSEWMYTYDGAIDATKLGAALRWACDTRRGAVAPLEAFGWERIGQLTVAAYHDLTRQPRPSTRRTIPSPLDDA